mmetsp:Transcript_132843/g.216418  ORF Transcript_132843/g.216418 Transcript_132843/m.216418 type:complete len:415 (+) Transcript_132843:78-1322(+)
MVNQSFSVRLLLYGTVFLFFTQSFASKDRDLPNSSANFTAASQAAVPEVGPTLPPAAVTQAAAPAQSSAAFAQNATSAVHAAPQSATAAQPPSANHAVPPVVRHLANEQPGASSSSDWRVVQLSTLIAGISFATVVKALCISSNVMVQVSPFPQVRRWKWRKCTGEADSAPFVSIAFNGCQWCFYGLFAWFVTGRSGFLVLVQANSLGAVLGTLYTITFYHNCRSPEALDSLQKYLSAVSALTLLQVCGMSVLPAERALFLIGLVSSFCSFIGATSVLVTIPQVLRCRDSRSIPGPYACANFFSSILWSLCGWLLDDPMVLLPSLFSTCCAMTAISCKLMYPSSDAGDGEKHGLSELCLLEDCEAKMGKMLTAKISKAGWSPIASEFTPIKSSQAAQNMATFRATCYDGTGGTY